MSRLTHFAIFIVSLATFSSAQADTYQLKTGGEVVGTLVERGDQGSYVVKTVEGVKLTLPRFDVVKIIPENPALLEYESRARSLPDTVEAHRQLAAWCTENRLNEQADHHWQRLLKIDPADQQARESLDYQRHGNRWMTREQIMQERGLVMYRGRYRTPQDIALREAQEQAEKVEADWYGTLKNYRNWLTNPRRSREAEEGIAQITDPHAVPALLKWLDDEPDQWTHRLLLETLQAIKHPDSIRTLVQLSIESPDPDERQQCIDYLLRLEDPISITPYVKRLTGKKNANVLVNRAAYALGQLGNAEAISPLIDALHTEHKYVTRHGSDQQIAVGMSSAGGGGLNVGGKGRKIITKQHQNLQVKRALNTLSGGEDYGYSEVAWRRWFVNEQQYKYYSSRRDQ